MRIFLNCLCDNYYVYVGFSDISLFKEFIEMLLMVNRVFSEFKVYRIIL